MWFSGLRGAIAFSLVLNMQSHSLTAVSPETKAVLVTTTLIVVLSTIFIFGGGTAPLLEMLLGEKKEIHIAVSKTSEMGAPLDLRESMDDWRYNESGTGNLSVASRRAAGFELYDKQVEWDVYCWHLIDCVLSSPVVYPDLSSLGARAACGGSTWFPSAIQQSSA